MRTKKNWIVLIVVVVCFLVGFASISRVPPERANWLSAISFVVSVLGFAYMIHSIFQLQEVAAAARRARDEITMRVTFQGKTEELAYRPLRGQVSRGELLGIVGLFAGVPRFETVDLLALLCSGDLRRITEGEQDQIDIEFDSANPESAGLFEEIVRRNAQCRLVYGSAGATAPVEGQS